MADFWSVLFNQLVNQLFPGFNQFLKSSEKVWDWTFPKIISLTGKVYEKIKKKIKLRPDSKDRLKKNVPHFKK